MRGGGGGAQIPHVVAEAFYNELHQNALKTYDDISDDHCDITTDLEISGNLRTHSGEETRRCTECSKSFRQVSHVKTRLQAHGDENLHKCTRCKKSFSEATDLRKHVLAHS